MKKKIPWAQDAFSLLCSVSPAGQERGKEHQLKVEKNIINPKKTLLKKPPTKQKPEKEIF